MRTRRSFNFLIDFKFSSRSLLGLKNSSAATDPGGKNGRDRGDYPDRALPKPLLGPLGADRFVLRVVVCVLPLALALLPLPRRTQPPATTTPPSSPLDYMYTCTPPGNRTRTNTLRGIVLSRLLVASTFHSSYKYYPVHFIVIILSLRRSLSAGTASGLDPIARET